MPGVATAHGSAATAPFCRSQAIATADLGRWDLKPGRHSNPLPSSRYESVSTDSATLEGYSDVPQAVRDVIDHAGQLMVVMFSPDMRVSWVNSTARDLLDIPEELGFSALELVHPVDVERAALGLASALEALGHGRSEMVDPNVIEVALHLQGRAGPMRSRLTLHPEFGPTTVRRLVAVARAFDNGVAVDEVIEALSVGVPLRSSVPLALRMLPEVMGSAVAVIWGNGEAAVYSPDHDGEMEPSGDDALLVAEELWADMRNEGVKDRLTDIAELPAATARVAHARGYRRLWVVPVYSPTNAAPLGCVLVWSLRPNPNFIGVAELVTTMCRVVALAVISDLSVRTLTHEATHDPLTGLLNRRGFDALISQVATPSAAMYIDLDRFKSVNDTWGHAVGDEVLAAVAARFRSAIRAGDVLARIGGDEFAALCYDVGDAETAAACAERLLISLRDPVVVRSQRFRMSASIGVTLSDPGSSPSLDRADSALREAKLAGKRRARLDGESAA